MKVAILANSEASYVRPMAEGLERMLADMGVESWIFYDGLSMLQRLLPPLRGYIRGSTNGTTPKNMLQYIKESVCFYRFVQKLRRFDVVIVVNTIPRAFLKNYFQIETLRAFLPRIPVVLYDVFYLPTRGSWTQWLREGNVEKNVPSPGNWGLERYDWYLCASVVSETPMPKGRQPYSLIGLNLADETLRPEPKDEFIALIDFEYPPHFHERAIQILACEKTKTKYIVLHGHYTISRIREIYRKCSIYFLASRESFGLPICELQACGAYVFTPYSNWCPSHWLKTDLGREGPGELSPNFIVYNNDLETLTAAIERIKASYDPQKVVDTFLRCHPQLFYGDKGELRKFVEMVDSGEIHSESHQEYVNITADPAVAFG